MLMFMLVLMLMSQCKPAFSENGFGLALHQMVGCTANWFSLLWIGLANSELV